METWSTHHLFQKTAVQLDPDTAALVQYYANQLRSRRLPVIFSLAHLGKITGVEYKFLHKSVSRICDSQNYQIFSIKKRSGGRRMVHAANGKLFTVQKFINDEILQKIPPHPASFAFHASGGIRLCAAMHCGCKWLLKFDLKDFFYTVTEPAVFKIFLEIGYRRILAFELARLCTTTYLPRFMSSYIKSNNNFDLFCDTYDTIKTFNGNSECIFKEDCQRQKKYPYVQRQGIGVLPQGAPTSPMLSNLAARNLDEALYDFAQNNGFVYTRYADDITFSATELPLSHSITSLRKEIIYIIRKNGFYENIDKFHIAGPGARKTVLGLLVDGDRPKLTKIFRKRIDRLFYSIDKYGTDAVASYDKFDSVYGFLNHLSGLMAFIHDVDNKLWYSLMPQFTKIKDSLNDIIL